MKKRHNFKDDDPVVQYDYKKLELNNDKI